MRLIRKTFFGGLFFSIVAASGGGWAQQSASQVVEGETEQQEAAEAEQQEAENLEEIVVTGSRIRRSSFTGAAPLQVIDTDDARGSGLISTTEFLQQADSASGAQIDSSYGNFVVDNGPGSAQVALRALGAGRTLVLLNGRRLPAAGIGGAPSSADISLLPSVAVGRIEILQDGASSVYGSDAVAGVVDVRTEEDLSGLHFDVTSYLPANGGGERTVLGVGWGASGENFSFLTAMEYFDSKKLTVGDLPYLDGCERNFEEDENGVVRSRDTRWPAGITQSECVWYPYSIVYLYSHDLATIYPSPGTTNIEIPGFSDYGANGLADFNTTVVPTDIDGDGEIDVDIIDADGDGRTDIDLHSPQINWQRTEVRRQADVYPETNIATAFAQLRFDLPNAPTSPSLFAEALYSKRTGSNFDGGLYQIFPYVSPSNPYNPCGGTELPEGGWNRLPGQYNCWAFFTNPETGGPYDFGPVAVEPALIIEGDRHNIDYALAQYFVAVGAEGELPFGSAEGYGDWYYELSLSQAGTKGWEETQGILAEELEWSLEETTVPEGGTIADATCPDLPSGKACVPVNLFASNLYQLGLGSFSTEEAAFLFGLRAIETRTTQTVASLVVQGDVWRLPWNETLLPLVLGYEYRRDEIDTDANDIAAQGLLWGWFADAGAKGSRYFHELYGETEFVLLTDSPWADEMTLNLSARYTKESTYGSGFTYSVKGLWRKDWLTLRATRGTSFRAPNAREQFLLGQSGFQTLTDPCIVPTSARLSTPGSQVDTYDAEEDGRSEELLQRCVDDGLDPTSFGLATADMGSINPRYSIEALQKGGEIVRSTLEPETSVGSTVGVIVDLPFGAVDFSFAATYWDVEIKDSIIALSASSVLSRCYYQVERQFCNQIHRNDSGPALNRISQIDYSYLNFQIESVRGMDYNIALETDLVVMDRLLELGLDITATNLRSVTDQFGEGAEINEYVDRTVYNDWKGTLYLSAGYGRFGFLYTLDFIGDFREPDLDYNPNNATCRYVVPDVACRPLGHSDENYLTSALSLSYEAGSLWELTLGVRNIFNKRPPLLDGSANGLAEVNLPLGAGYDIEGRSYFLNFSFRIGGG